MHYPKIPLAQTVITLCKAKNIKHIIISPGSRSAPLTIGFTSDPFFKCYSIVDERCAAFFALGIAQQTKHPVAVVCTSGSALLNYYPAVCEAFYSNIPLVVLSADRPKYLVNIGDGQTINQDHVYGKHSLYSVNLKQDLKDGVGFNKTGEVLPIFKNLENTLEKYLGLQKTVQLENEEQINKALNISIVQSGPVHVNCPFDEPLYETTKKVMVSPRLISLPEKAPENTDYKTFSKQWNTAKRKLVLVGVLSPNTIEQKYLEHLAKDESVIVLTETTSNLHHDFFIPSIDKLIGALTKTEFENLQPDILLTLGGLVISKKIKKFLRDYKPKQHWHVGLYRANDTFFSLNKVFKQLENLFFESFIYHVVPVSSNYRNFWLGIMKIRREKHELYMNQMGYCDFKVFNAILKSLPDAIQLQVGNSSAIRYTQLFDLNNTVSVFSNRGTSGIDGSTSTAIGASIINKKQTVFITGDLSFFYDSNALWNNYIPNNFRIILINNGGGGIFRILPGHKNTDNFDTFFETKHNLTAKQLCEMYLFEYNVVKDEEALVSKLKTFYSESKQPKLLEIFTPTRENDTVLLNYFKFII